MRNFLLEDFYEKHEFSTPYLLSQSDCESMTVEELLHMEPDAKKRFMQSWLGYTEVKGSPELRERIAALYKSCAPDDILVHAGAEEAIFSFMQVFLAAGDHVVYMSPAYQSLYEVTMSLGCEVSPWLLCQGDSGWTLDIDELELLLKPNTKLIVLNTPHNPTGYSLTDDEHKRIADIARDRGVFVFCDQVYKGLEWDGQAHSWMSDFYENAISLGVLSKAYGLPGLRIGWIATRNKDVYDMMVKFKYYTTICCSAPSEFLAIVALKHGEDILRRNVSVIKENITYAEDFFSKHAEAFINNAPAAGPIAFHKLKLSGGIRAFCENLIQRKGVLLLPGDVYEVKGDYFRMGYGRKNFRECLNQLEQHLSG